MLVGSPCIRDMKALPQVINEDFKHFRVIQKTKNIFSCIPVHVDQTHELNNELVKGSGGPLGLTENQKAFVTE